MSIDLEDSIIGWNNCRFWTVLLRSMFDMRACWLAAAISSKWINCSYQLPALSWFGSAMSSVAIPPHVMQNCTHLNQTSLMKVRLVHKSHAHLLANRRRMVRTCQTFARALWTLDRSPVSHLVLFGAIAKWDRIQLSESLEFCTVD